MRFIFQRLLLLIILASFSIFLNAQSGYEINIKIDNYDQKECYLGYFFGDKQYLKDTAQVDEEGYFTFKGEEDLDAGVYLIVLPPDNQFFQLLVNEGEQQFTIKTDYKNLTTNVEVTNSEDNQLFYGYLDFLAEQRPVADNLRKSIEEAGEDEAKKAKFEEKLAMIDESVFTYQDELIANYPKTLTAAIVKSNKGTSLPEFTGTEEEIQMKKWQFSKTHYFDNIDLMDERMVRTPFLFQRINHFITKLTAQHPDSIIQSIDTVLSKMDRTEDTYKYYLVHFLNEYAKSKIVGFDAVYVHLALNYYKKGKAHWTDEDQLEKIISNGEKLEPLLLGKIAPNIKMQTKAGEEIELHNFKSDYTVLFFWDPDCGHCKKATPKMLEFYEKFHSQGVDIFGICTKLVEKDKDGKWTTEGMKECWEYTEENGTNLWLNTIDPYHRSRYKSVYDIRTTPQIYVLDKNKEIILKKVGAEQLSEVMEQILKDGKTSG